MRLCSQLVCEWKRERGGVCVCVLAVFLLSCVKSSASGGYCLQVICPLTSARGDGLEYQWLFMYISRFKLFRRSSHIYISERWSNLAPKNPVFVKPGTTVCESSVLKCIHAWTAPAVWMSAHMHAIFHAHACFCVSCMSDQKWIQFYWSFPFHVLKYSSSVSVCLMSKFLCRREGGKNKNYKDDWTPQARSHNSEW